MAGKNLELVTLVNFDLRALKENSTFPNVNSSIAACADVNMTMLPLCTR